MTTALDHTALEHWQENPIAFIEAVLCDPESGQPFVLLEAERQFLQLAFTLGEDGKLLYPEMVFGAIKKSGKTTLAGIIMLAMILLFGGCFAEGYCVANDLEQAQSRVFAMIKRIIEASPLLQREAKVTADKVVFPSFHNATIIALASDAASAAGSNPVITCFDELWGYTSERSRRLFDEMITSPARKISARLTVTYAGFEGESVLLEELYKRGSVLPEVAPSLRAGDGMLFAWHHEPIAPWQTESWLSEMRKSLRPNAYLRMIENRWVGSESSFIHLASWDACVDPSVKPVLADRLMSVWVGVDASIKHDSTAIVAVTWDNDRPRLVAHRVFQPQPDDPLDFEGTIERTLLDFNKRFHIEKILFDPYQMHATAQRLARENIAVEEFPQTVSNLTDASQNLYEIIRGRNFVAYPDAGIRLAISRAIAIETSRGWRIAKDKQSHKIDVVVALAMAALAAVRANTEDTYDISMRWCASLPGDAEAEAQRTANEEWAWKQYWTSAIGASNFFNAR